MKQVKSRIKQFEKRITKKINGKSVGTPTIKLVIKKEGKYYHNGKEMTEAELKAFEQSKNSVLFITSSTEEEFREKKATTTDRG